MSKPDRIADYWDRSIERALLDLVKSIVVRRMGKDDLSAKRIADSLGVLIEKSRRRERRLRRASGNLAAWLDLHEDGGIRGKRAWKALRRRIGELENAAR